MCQDPRRWHIISLEEGQAAGVGLHICLHFVRYIFEEDLRKSVYYWKQKRAKYVALEPQYLFVANGSEALEPWGKIALQFLSGLGFRLIESIEDARANFLIQRLSIAMQLGRTNCANGSRTLYDEAEVLNMNFTPLKKKIYVCLINKVNIEMKGSGRGRKIFSLRKRKKFF